MTTPSVLPLSPRQMQAISEATGRVNIWSGSVRSGKTISSLLRWLIYVATTDHLGELVVVARTREAAARNVFGPLAEPSLFGPVADQVHYTSGAATATMLGKTVHVLGASDAKAERVLRGLTCAGAYVDEVTLVTHAFFTQLLNRLWREAQLFGTTNPDNPVHWLKRDFLDRLDALPDWRHWKFYLDDNPQLTEANKAAIRRENVGLFYRRYVLGEWVAAEGSVFDMFDPDVHVVPRDGLPWMQRWLALGVDYGDRNPFAAVLLGLGEDDRLYAVDEWRYDGRHEQRQMTQPQYSAALRSWLAGIRRPQENGASGVEPEWVLVDPSAAGFINQLWQDGTPGVLGAQHEVLDGIRSVAGLLAQRRLLIADSCPALVEELLGYSWDDKAGAKGEDRPVKVADHSVDALRYAVHSTAHAWRGLLLEEASGAAA